MASLTERIVFDSVLGGLPLAARKMCKHVSPEDIPPTADLFSVEALETHLGALDEPAFSLVAGGDIMLGGRTRKVIADHGADYPFQAVRPVLRRASIVLGNLEGPFARTSRRVPRTHSYRVNPDLAGSLARAGICLVTLANNHLLDCGRAGVLETLDALACAGVAHVGAGVNNGAAHAPVIRQAGRWKVGFLGYYWNSRCAATGDLPGSAMDPPQALQDDIRSLRDRVDRLVVTFHWGVPYVREPAPEDRAKARMAIDLGADVVIGHHPHIVQPLEVYRGCPILYSIGNLALGSGNSRAEGMLLALRFEELCTHVEIFPLYVKNRDARVNYQPKILRGPSAERFLRSLAEASGPSGKSLQLSEGRGRLDLPRPSLRRQGGGNDA